MIFATKIDKSRSINWGLWANWDLIPSRRYSIWHSWRTFVIYLDRRQGTNESLKHLPANPMSWFGNQVGWLFKFSVCCLLVHLLTRYRSNPKSGRQMVHCNKSSLTDLLNPMNQIMEGSGWENLRLYLSLWLMMMQGDTFYIKRWTNLLIIMIPVWF